MSDPGILDNVTSGVFRISTKGRVRGGVLGEKQPAPSPPARGSGTEPRPPSAFTKFEVLRKASPDTSLVLLLVKTWTHRTALDCCQNCLPETRLIVSFSSALYKQSYAPFATDFACVTCVRFVTHTMNLTSRHYPTECRGYMWKKSISKLFQPSWTSLWNNFISTYELAWNYFI